MIINIKRKLRHPDAPQRHNSHNRPMTRRELIGQGFMAGCSASSRIRARPMPISRRTCAP